MMEKKVKEREKWHARIKSHIQRQAKSARTKRARPKARKLRKEEKDLKSAARAARRKERRERLGEVGAEVEVKSMEPEKNKKWKPKKDKSGKERQKEVKKLRKVLMRAPMKMREKTQSNEKEKAAKDIGSKDGWKAGSRKMESEKAPTRKEKKVKKLPEEQVIKLLKKVMNLARKETDVTVFDVKEENPESEVLPSSALGVGEELPQNSEAFEEDLGALGEAFKEFSEEDGGGEAFKEAAQSNENTFFKENRGGGAFEETLRSNFKKREKPMAHPEANLTSTSDSGTESSDGSDQDRRCGVKRYVKRRGEQVFGTMRGGANEKAEEPFTELDMIRQAIQISGERLELDSPTRGDGNCGPRALVQQCQRHSVKIFLQRRGVTISTFKEMKKYVANFIRENAKDQRVQDLKENFEQGQSTLHEEEKAVKEHLRLEARTWEKYWIDMRKDAGQERGKRWRECWADDIWLGAAALYLNMDIHILRAGDETAGQMIVVEGNWAPAEDKPALYLGYISNAHYQSLIPVPTTENVLAEVVYAMMLQLEQDNQVRFEKL